MVDSGPGPPNTELRVKLRLPDFSSDIEPGPREILLGLESILAWPVFIGAPELGPGRPLSESGAIPDQPNCVNNFNTGPGKSFPRYGTELWMQDWLGAIEDESEALLRE